MGMKRLFFNSSMPRSMSTLLQCILNQNPAIWATPTDPVLEYVYSARAAHTTTPEVKAMDQELARKTWLAFCRGGIEAYAEAYTDRSNLCIKTRGATIHYRLFESILEQKPKMICMVRDLRSILSSMEKLHRAGFEKHQAIVNHGEMKGTNTQKRVMAWLQSPPVGMALERLQQCFLEGINKEILYVRAEDLTTRPDEQMKRIYDYLGMDNFQHDFSNVEQTVKEDDSAYGLTNDLHTIRREVKPLKVDHDIVLGAQLCEWINRTHAWYQKQFGYMS
jgi:sulfotransferase